jgi:hypothetical protein
MRSSVGAWAIAREDHYKAQRHREVSSRASARIYSLRYVLVPLW